MERNRRALLCALLAAALAGSAALAEGLRTSAPAVLYSGLSEKSPPLAIFEKGFPLRGISRINNWQKVETHERVVGWILSENLETAAIAVVSVDRAEVRAAPRLDAEGVFAAERGVLLDITADRPGDWLEVSHAEGESGYVLKREVWRNGRSSP